MVKKQTMVELCPSSFSLPIVGFNLYRLGRGAMQVVFNDLGQSIHSG